MFKVFTISMCYNDPEIIEESIAQYYKTKSKDVETVHVLLDQHWPVNYRPERLKALAEKVGCIYLDAGHNRGLEGGFNFALKSLNIPDNAGVIGYDPDCFPVTPNWDKAMCEVFVAGPSVVWLSLWQEHAHRELLIEGRQKTQETIGGHNVVVAGRPCLNSICMWRAGWLREIGGLPDVNRAYGGLEVRLWEKLNPSKHKWVFLKGFEEINMFSHRVNPKYTQWKHDYALFHKTNLTFEKWVQQ